MRFLTAFGMTDHLYVVGGRSGDSKR